MKDAPPSAAEIALNGASLRHREREHVRKLVAAEARDKCHETRAAYLECAKGAPLIYKHSATLRATLIKFLKERYWHVATY